MNLEAIDRAIKIGSVAVNDVVKITDVAELVDATRRDLVRMAENTMRLEMAADLAAAGWTPSAPGTLEFTDKSAGYAASLWDGYATACYEYLDIYVRKQGPDNAEALRSLNQANTRVAMLESASNNLLAANQRAYNEAQEDAATGLLDVVPGAPAYMASVHEKLDRIIEILKAVQAPMQTITTDGVDVTVTVAGATRTIAK